MDSEWKGSTLLPSLDYSDLTCHLACFFIHLWLKHPNQNNVEEQRVYLMYTVPGDCHLFLASQGRNSSSWPHHSQDGGGGCVENTLMQSACLMEPIFFTQTEGDMVKNPGRQLTSKCIRKYTRSRKHVLQISLTQFLQTPTHVI